MQSVLVAGGAGFIGSHLCLSLLEDGYRVTCLDNFITGDKENIKNLFSNDNFSLIEEDIINLDLELIPEVDYVFHLASPASPNLKSPRSYMAFPIETMRVNSEGTRNLLEICLSNKAKFLFASTSEIYGDPEVSPQSEDYFGNVNPNGIRSVYDESKRFGEALTNAYRRKHSIDTRIIRIFNTYGSNMREDDGRVVSNFIVQALNNQPLTIYGNGNQTRSFCYVSDMVEGIKKAMFLEKTNGEVINLGNPDERSIKEIAEIIKKLTGSNSEIDYSDLPQDDPHKRNPDIQKAKDILKWSPKVSLEEGLGKTIQYFKS